MNTQQGKHFESLWVHAAETGDAILMALLNSYTHHPKDWGDFLVDVILTQSTVNKDLRDRLVEVISNQPPAPIILNGTQYSFVPDGAWASDYPPCYLGYEV